MLAGMLWASSGETTTYDETLYLGAAVGYVYEHDVSWSWEHPPFSRWLSGVALRVAGTHNPLNSEGIANHSDVDFGRAILYDPDNNPERVLFFARLPIMGLTLLFGLVVFAFSRDLWGDRAGPLSVALFSFTPDVLAHGHLATTDMAVAGFLLASMWLLWRSHQRGPRYLLPATLAMGLALSSKFTALVFVPVFLGLLLWSTWPHTLGASLRSRCIRMAALALACGLGCLAVLWASYLIIDPALSYDRQPEPVGLAASGLMARIANLLPVPEAYRQGLRFAIGAEGGRQAFLLGDFYTGGRPTYFPLGLLIKTPLGALVLWFGGFVTTIWRRRFDVILVLVLPASLWMVVAMTSQMNIGVRHVLPVVLFMTVLAGAALDRAVPEACKVVAVLALFMTATSTWVAFPNYLSYSNEIAGGIGKTYKRLSDSNVDWGQDLRRLDNWLLDNHPSGPLYLAYFGTAPARKGGHPI